MTAVVERHLDRELWLRGVAGDAEAFGQLFELHATAIYNFCFRRTGSWADAEDAVSDVFLVAWKRRGQVTFTTEDRRVGRIVSSHSPDAGAVLRRNRRWT